MPVAVPVSHPVAVSVAATVAEAGAVSVSVTVAACRGAAIGEAGWPCTATGSAAAPRPDVTVVDRHVTRDDQMRLIEASDCLVSLHRSEGLGLHLMEAMWLRTPVIATRYSGNLDFMNDGNSVLVDAELIPVTDRQGYYPTSAVWADADLDQAADAMRRLSSDAGYHERLADAAHRDMMNQRSMTHTGHLIARLCRDAVPTAVATTEE